MIKKYHFEYNYDEADVYIDVDLNKFTEESAQVLLDFFSWNYDKKKDPIDELMKKYAMKAIQIAAAENYNEEGIKSWFADQEGFIAIDGSQGVTLKRILPYEFDEDNLTMNIS